MPRDPREIQLEIDAARESLAATLDQLAYRGNPKRLTNQAREAALIWLQTPAGKATVGAVGLLLSLSVIRRIRRRRD